ncbi:MAG: Hpt domain-containing protein [Sulfurimonas sp.]|jgi:HPt (histidine-containing phosphotransfer) domain-containing protein
MKYSIDLQKIADELEFDLEDVEMLLEVFLESTKDSLSALKEAIDKDDFERTFRSAHAIKGSASNLTLMEISNLAKEIEYNSREKKAIDYVQKFENLKKSIENIIIDNEF